MAEKKASLLLVLQDKVSNGLTKVGGRLDKIRNQVEKSKFVWAGLSAVIGLTATAFLSAAGKMEQWRIAFSTMLGSADRAEVLLAKIRDFAAKTPFELPQVVEGSKRLLAFGIEAEKIIPTMKSLGDVAAAAGSEKFPQIVNAFGQVRVAGRLMGQEMLQFINAGVPLIETLADQFGVTTDKVKKLGEQGKISFADVEKAFQTMSAEGGDFANLMEKQSKTLFGVFSNIKDNIFQISLAFGEVLLPTIKRVAGFVLALTERLKEMSPQAKIITLIIGGLTGAFVGLVSATGALIAAAPIIAAAWAVITGPIGIASAAIIGLGIVITALVTDFLEMRTIMMKGITELAASWTMFIGAIKNAVAGNFDNAMNLMKSAARNSARAMTDSFGEFVDNAKNKWNELKNHQIFKEIETNETLNAIREEQKIVEDEKHLEKLAKLDEETAQILEKFNQREIMRIGILNSFNMQEAKLLNKHLSDTEKAELLSLQRRLKEEGKFNEARLIGDMALKQAQMREEEALSKFREEQRQARVRATEDTLTRLASLQSAKTKEFALIGKAAAAAMTVIDTHRAAMGAYASLSGIPFVGPGLAAAAAAAIIAAGAANLARIQGVQLAHGGMVLPTQGGTLATIGEAGRAEAVIPLDDPRTKRMMSDNFGEGVTININAGTIIADDFSIKEFAQKIDEELFALKRNRQSVAFGA